MWILSMNYLVSNTQPPQQKTLFIRTLMHVLRFSSSVSSSCAVGEMTPLTTSKVGQVNPKKIVSLASDGFARGLGPHWDNGIQDTVF